MKQDELRYVLRQSSPRIVLPFWGRYHFEALKLPSSALWLTDCVDSFTSDTRNMWPKRGFVVVILLGVTKKKQGKKNAPRRSSTSDRVVIGSLCWIWLTKGMTRVFYDQALSKVKQNYCDQQNSLSSNGKRTLSAWMRLKHNQISVKFTKFIFYFIFWFCFVLFFHTYITNLVYRQYLLHRFLLQQTGYIRVEGLLWIKTEGDIKYTSSLHILWSGATVGRA